MKNLLTAVLLAAAGLAHAAPPASPPSSPIYGVTLPEGYRKWPFIAPAHETPPLDELRVVVGNPVAMVNGQPADLAQHQTCWACHQALVRNHDFVFTRLAP